MKPCEHVIQSSHGVAIAGSATCPWCEVKDLAAKLDAARTERDAIARKVLYWLTCSPMSERLSGKRIDELRAVVGARKLYEGDET
jgi:hypothetical protein